MGISEVELLLQNMFLTETNLLKYGCLGDQGGLAPSALRCPNNKISAIFNFDC